jgi:hypothetical protein
MGDVYLVGRRSHVPYTRMSLPTDIGFFVHVVFPTPRFLGSVRHFARCTRSNTVSLRFNTIAGGVRSDHYAGCVERFSVAVCHLILARYARHHRRDRALAGPAQTRFNLIMMGSFLATTPMLLLFVVMQRYFIEGVSTSGINR